MKSKRIIENILEFLLLCIATYLFLKKIGKGIASHDGIVFVVLLLGYGLTIFINLMLQTIILINSSKHGYHYLLAKIKLFAIVLLMPIILCTYFIRDGFLIFLLFSIVVFVAYIFFTLLLFLISVFINQDFKTKTIKNDFEKYKKNG